MIKSKEDISNIAEDLSFLTDSGISFINNCLFDKKLKLVRSENGN